MSAEWIRRKDKYHEWYECSYCGMRVMKHQMDVLVDRCPHCKSKMTIKERKEDDV
jgi:DNA-directed RNA polymerase subunit RPC12/RpoP